MSKKLLNEQTIRRFQKLASIKPLGLYEQGGALPPEDEPLEEPAPDMEAEAPLPEEEPSLDPGMEDFDLEGEGGEGDAISNLSADVRTEIASAVVDGVLSALNVDGEVEVEGEGEDMELPPEDLGEPGEGEDMELPPEDLEGPEEELPPAGLNEGWGERPLYEDHGEDELYEEEDELYEEEDELYEEEELEEQLRRNKRNIAKRVTERVMHRLQEGKRRETAIDKATNRIMKRITSGK